MELPRFYKIKQHFEERCIENVPEYLRNQLSKSNSIHDIKPGMRIAITAGSRGIDNLVPILRTTVEYLKELHAEPFIVGSMGSHGGGTAEGQRELLQSLGVNEETVGCGVYTSSETVEIVHTNAGLAVFCDKKAWESDGIIVFNRIKPHTAFHGPNESGLLKMITVGLGKANGASQLHRLGPNHMSAAIREIGQAFLNTGKIICGIAAVENQFDKTSILEIIEPNHFITREQDLLIKAKAFLPTLPTDELDILVIRMMGKNYSGTGMDTNVIGRSRMFGVPEPDSPKFARVVVLDLDDASHGNATGIGLADLTTERLFQKIDRQKTYFNCTTSTYVQRAMIPMIMPSDKAAIETAMLSLAAEDPMQLRMAVIDDTLHVQHALISESVARELTGNPKIETISQPINLKFSTDGTLL